MDQIFRKNFKVLQQQNSILAQRLSEIHRPEKYEIYNESGSVNVDLNLYDKVRQEAIYEQPQEELSQQIEYFVPMQNYFYFYLFGIGNGFFVLALLHSFPRLQRLVLIEPEIELLAIAFHLHDFSEYIASGRLKCFTVDQCNESMVQNILFEHNAITSARLFDIYTTKYYVKNYEPELRIVTEMFKFALEYYLQLMGNNISDQMTGIQQTINHLSFLPKSPSLSELCKKRNSELAVIVSTGPSLAKQLPFLKKAAPYVTLISVDASLPILEQHDIKPDIVVSMERDEPTAVFFEKTSSKFREGIVFVCAVLQHPLVFSTLKDNIVVPVFRPLQSNKSFKMDEYGYIGKGFSAANMAHDLAYKMGFKNVVLIGQDLSFGSDGTTHSQGHVFESDPDIQREIEAGNLFYIPAYGGQGVVKTHKYWKAFLDGLRESTHEYTPKMKTLNATEGGAKIPGTIEIPFQTVIETMVSFENPKTRIELSNPNSSAIKRTQDRLDKSIQILIAEGRKMLKKIVPMCEELYEITIEFNSDFVKDDLMLKADSLVLKIEDLREMIMRNKVYETFYITTISPILMDMELAIVEMVQRPSNDPWERKKGFIELHKHYFEAMYNTSKTILEILQTYKVKNTNF